jgi:hypothetical protein
MPATFSRDLRKTVHDLIELIKTTGNIVIGVSKLLTVLSDAGLVYTVRLHSSLVLVHRDNRDQCGVGAYDVHELCDTLTDVGFEERLVDGICVEIDQLDLEFNATMIQEADGMLGSCDPAVLAKARFASLAASHTNFCLRIVNEQVAHEGRTTITKDGKFSLAVCEASAPSMYKACVEGLVWRAIRKEVVTEFPEIPELVQQCGNTKAERGEHELQICRRLHNLITGESKRLKRAVTYYDVKEAAHRSKPKCAASLS